MVSAESCALLTCSLKKLQRVAKRQLFAFITFFFITRCDSFSNRPTRHNRRRPPFDPVCSVMATVFAMVYASLGLAF